MTLLVRLNDGLLANILLSILLGFLAAMGLLQLATYLGGGDLEIYLECQVAMVLAFVLMIVVGVLNVLNALAVARLVKTPQVLRALYFFLLFPVVFAAIMLANSAEGYAAVLIFGAPLFIVGAVLMPYFANVIFVAAGGQARRATVMLLCHRCGFMFLVYRDSSGARCPMCHVANRNPLWNGQGAAVPAPSPGDLPDAAAAPPPGGWSEVKPAILDPDWQDDRLGAHPGTSLFGSYGRLLRTMGLVLLAAGATLSFGIGMALALEGADWGDGWEVSAGVSMLLLGIAGICAAAMRARGYWLAVAVAACALLCVMGAWFATEWDTFLGIVMTIMGVWAAVCLIAGGIHSRGVMPSGHRVYVGPASRGDPMHPDEGQLGRKGW